MGEEGSDTDASLLLLCTCGGACPLVAECLVGLANPWRGLSISSVLFSFLKGAEEGGREIGDVVKVVIAALVALEVGGVTSLALFKSSLIMILLAFAGEGFDIAGPSTALSVYTSLVLWVVTWGRRHQANWLSVMLFNSNSEKHRPKTSIAT